VAQDRPGNREGIYMSNETYLDISPPAKKFLEYLVEEQLRGFAEALGMHARSLTDHHMLTRREQVAAQLLAGFIARTGPPPVNVYQIAVMHADVLLQELAK